MDCRLHDGGNRAICTGSVTQPAVIYEHLAVMIVSLDGEMQNRGHRFDSWDLFYGVWRKSIPSKTLRDLPGLGLSSPP